LETQDTIEVGAEAPEFNLKDQHKTAHNMSDLRGKKVLLSFHPLAWTSICTQQMESLETHMAEFSDLNTVPFGVSIDSSPSKLAWGDSMGIKELKMLTDFWPHGGYAQELGLFRHDMGFTNRANVIIDEEGKVEFVKVYDLGELPDIQEILDHIREVEGIEKEETR
jgi:peroxiredoxin